MLLCGELQPDDTDEQQPHEDEGRHHRVEDGLGKHEQQPRPGARRKAGTAFFRRRRECLSYIRPIACGSAVDTAGIKVTSSRPPMMAT